MTLQEFYARHTSRHGTRLVVTVLFLIAAFAYFSWRLTVFNPQAWVFSIVFFLAEFFGLVVTFFTLFVTWRVKVRSPTEPPAGLSVDVLIPTYNESVEIIRLTALAAVNIRYPHSTWILDDGKREEIRHLADEIGCHYIARENNDHAKAGNLNNALRHVTGDFVAIFDADHVPEENFLDRLLGYFNDPQVSFVQAPQDFYNIDSFQFSNVPSRKLLWHDQTFFYQVGQAGRDYWNAASWCGTTSILRRSALDAVGGIATDTVTEDMQTAIRLQKAGYKSVYHPESLAFGVAATTYVEYLQQRLRWGHGNVQTLREEGLPFCKGLTVPQRICYTALGLGYFEGLTRLLLYITPAIVLLTGIAPIGDTRLFFYFFIPYFILAWLCIEECGHGDARFFTSEYMAMARFPVYLLSCLGLFLKRTYWRITSKERNADVSVYYIVPQLMILILNQTALVVGVVSPPDILIQSMSGGTIAVICFWALFNIVLAFSVILSVITTRTTGVSYQVHLPVPVSIARDDDSETYTVDRLSADEMVFVTAAMQLQPGDRVDCTLQLQDVSVSTTAEIVTVEPRPEEEGIAVSCRFQWSDKKQRDRLNLKLHHCRWHRELFWHGGYFRTPLEIAAGMIGRLFPTKLLENYK